MTTNRCRNRRAVLSFSRALHAEWLRLRRSSLIALHAALSLALGLAAGLYFAMTPWNSLLGYDAFVQLLGAGAPLLAGIACGLAIDVEREAGEYANLLGQPSRRCALAAKGMMLLMLGALPCLCAIALFVGVMAAAGRPLPDPAAIAASFIGVVAGSIVLYALLIAAALAWGRNAAIGLGALGFMCALASLGGLGNGLVTGTLSAALAPFFLMAVPFVWPTRLASLAVELFIAKTGAIPGAVEAFDALLHNAYISVSLCLVGTVAIVGALLAGANRFEGAHRINE
ncbi:MAG: ABC transporter permease [Slackia sp.]|nr:ABC transporter permease [Slackia sp.]